MVGDGMFFYVFNLNNLLPGQWEVAYFGDINTFKNGDAYHCAIGATTLAVNYGSASFGTILAELNSTYPLSYLARAHAQTGASEPFWFLAIARSGVNGGQINYPSSVDGSLMLHDTKLLIESGSHVRGQLPGFLTCLQKIPLAHGDIVTNALGPGKHVLLASLGIGVGLIGGSARMAFDISGDWR